MVLMDKTLSLVDRRTHMKKTILFMMIFLVCMKLVTIKVYAKEEKKGGFTDTSSNYIYEITPKSDKWAELNHGERVEFSQIPNDEMTKMNTMELARAVLDYPCFCDLLFYDDVQNGFLTVAEHFNGLKELLSRDDAGTNLLLWYLSNTKNLYKADAEDIDDINKALKIYYAEIILAQPDILQNMNSKELQELNSIMSFNYEKRKKNKIDFPSYSGFYDVTNKVSAEKTSNRAYVQTPKGNYVYVDVITGEDIYYNSKETLAQIIECNYPGAVVVGDATNRYNCHSYAWALRNDVWMCDPSAYWTDGSYTLRCYNSPSAIGQVIYYPNLGDTHSGRVVSLTGNMIRSKWGPQSLVLHSVTNCPYFYIPLQVQFYNLYTIP